jgi:hypothetical protein
MPQNSRYLELVIYLQHVSPSLRGFCESTRSLLSSLNIKLAVYAKMAYIHILKYAKTLEMLSIDCIQSS